MFEKALVCGHGGKKIDLKRRQVEMEEGAGEE